jgi:hypothetical protein
MAAMVAILDMRRHWIRPSAAPTTENLDQSPITTRLIAIFRDICVLR